MKTSHECTCIGPVKYGLTFQPSPFIDVALGFWMFNPGQLSAVKKNLISLVIMKKKLIGDLY